MKHEVCSYSLYSLFLFLAEKRFFIVINSVCGAEFNGKLIYKLTLFFRKLFRHINNNAYKLVALADTASAVGSMLLFVLFAACMLMAVAVAAAVV